MNNNYKLAFEGAQMACTVDIFLPWWIFLPGTARWEALTNPLSHGGLPTSFQSYERQLFCHSCSKNDQLLDSNWEPLLSEATTPPATAPTNHYSGKLMALQASMCSASVTGNVEWKVAQLLQKSPKMLSPFGPSSWFRSIENFCKWQTWQSIEMLVSQE